MSSDPRERLARMKANPRNVRFAEIEAFLKSIGYRLDRQRGSHHTFAKAGWPSVTIPKQKPQVKKVYIDNLVDALEERLNDELADA